MSCNWPLVKVDDLKAKTKGSIAIGPFGSRMKSDCYVEKGVPIIRGTNITEGPDFKGEFVFITEEKADELGSCNVYQNDLVFPHRGSIGEVGIILDDQRYVLSSSLMKISCDTQKVNPQFLYYFFKSRLGRYELLKNASQVGTPGIGQPLTSLKGIELRLPPLSIQDQITGTLSSINQKIAKNASTNQTLEQMAQAIFKSWFVDFDPVKAKMNGEQPEGMDAATASLFPEKLVESELGLIPEGWEVKPLDKVAHFQNGLALQKFRPESEGDDFLPVLKIAQLRQGYCDGKEKARTDIKESCRVYDGDMIFSWSGTLMIDLWTGGNAALNQHLFKVTSEEYNLPLYLYWTKHHLAKFQQIAKDKAVTMGHIKRGHLSESLCVIPPKALREKLDEVLLPLINQGLNLRLQSNQLATLRDILLPKLLSGEIELAPQGNQ